MSAAVVERIIDQIKGLPPEDRSLFDELLARLEEDEWQHEADKARQVAREKGIDQNAIDDAVHRVRYGS